MTFLRELAVGEGLLLTSTVVASLVHEGGHALAIVAMRFELRMISIGMGPAVLRLRLGRAWLAVRAFPISGVSAGTSRDRCRPDRMPRHGALAGLGRLPPARYYLDEARKLAGGPSRKTLPRMLMHVGTDIEAATPPSPSSG